MTVFRWKQEYAERGPEVFGGDEEVKEGEKRISQLERMLGQKMVVIPLLTSFLNESGRWTTRWG